MKKSAHKTSQHRKLVLHGEAIAVLAPPQLGHVMGGAADGWSFFGGCPFPSNSANCAPG
jgi:hypothetical protein